MPAERTCPRCGNALTADAFDGLCPACIGRAAFGKSPVVLDATGISPDLREPALTPEIAAELARLKPEEAGEWIGSYKLIEQIGQGGFGTVWVADQEQPVRRRVALKIIKLGMDTKEVIARFEQERQALAMMDHPSIAKVFDAGATLWGRPFFVMELVRGVKITDYCDQANLPTADRLALFIQVCNAVQHAHQKGIIHRDLKPSNILVTLHDGVPVPKVIDFGVAKATQQQRLTDLTIYTQFQQMIGTPLYMSPEQAEMSGLDIDTRSDIYSLGVLLYELLTGRTPFDPEELMQKGHDEIRRTICEVEPQTPSMFLQTMADETRAVVAQHRQSDPAKLTKLVRGDLDWIVMRALEKDRARRYETAKSLADDIQRHLDTEPVLARPASQFYRFRRLVKRNKVAFFSSALVALAIVTALVVVSLATVRIAHEKSDKDVALRERGIALETARNREREARESLVRALKNEAQARRSSRRIGQRFDALAAVAAAAKISPDEELRDIAIAALALPDLRRGASWTAPGTGGKMCYDARYRSYAFTDGDGNVSIRTIPEGKEIWKIATGPATWTTALSPGGEYLVVLGEKGRLRVWKVADGQLALAEAPENCNTFDFTSDSRQLAVAQGDRILRFDMTTGREINRWPIHPGVSYLDFDATGGKLAVGYIRSAVTSICDVATGSILTDLPVGLMAGQIVTWHPDGDHVAVAGTDYAIQIWDWASKQRTAVLSGHVQQIRALSFHPDGGILASYSSDGTLRLWEPWSGRELLQTPIEGGIQFSMDGRIAGVAWDGENRIQLLEVAAFPEFRSLPAAVSPEHPGYYEGDISSEGRFLALGMSDGVRLWEIATGRQIAHLPIGDSRCVLFRPDLRKLLLGHLGSNLLQQCAINETSPNEIRLGPFEPSNLPPCYPMRMQRTRDGLQFAIVSETTGEIVVHNAAVAPPSTRRYIHPNACYVALSSDGRLVASSGWNSDKVRLFDTTSGKLIHEWSDTRRAKVFFTPDGRELVISLGDSFSFWDVETFERKYRLPSGVAQYPGFAASSEDGRLMALEISPGIVELHDPKSHRSLAKLENPFGDPNTWMAFTPSGSELVAVSVYGHAIHIWDLRTIHDRLIALGVECAWPSFEAMRAAAEPSSRYHEAPLKVEILEKLSETP